MIPRNDATTTPNLTSPIKSMLLALAALLGGLLAALALRIYVVLPRIPRRSSPPPPAAPTASLAVFLGSGGHTAEMRALLASVDKARYTPRIYVYGAGDNMSLRAVAEVEGDASSAGYSLLALPRARRVGEGRLSTLLSATKTLLVATWYTFLLPLLQRPSRPWADVLLLNGPGTAVVLVLVMYIRRILGLSYTRIIYVESFARVKSLSLSGKLLRPLVDTFVTQWPGAGAGGGTCRGWLV